MAKPKSSKKDEDATPGKKAGAANPAKAQGPDPLAAQKAFDTFKPRMLGLDPAKLAARSVDLEKAAIAGAAVGRWVLGKDARARFARLPKEDFKQAHVEELETLALAAWHAAVELRTASAGKSEAKLPVALVEKATAIKTRMLALVEYHFGSDPVDGPEILDIKLGSGYTDLASDLQRLAKLYAKHRARVKLDPKNYRESDAADAGRCAHEIFQLLGEQKNQQQKAWSDLALRAFTLLAVSYGEVASAGGWLWRNEGASELFPSLYLVGRATPVRGASKNEQGDPQDEDDGEDDEGTTPGTGPAGAGGAGTGP